jgi:hemoglobin
VADLGDIATADDVGHLVRSFYRTAIPDPVLGPIFEAAGIDWTVHVPHIARFWELQLLGIEGFQGNLVRKHVEVADKAEYGRPEIERWIELWTETVDDLYAGPVADHAKARAREAGSVIGAALDRRSRGTVQIHLG